MREYQVTFQGSFSVEAENDYEAEGKAQQRLKNYDFDSFEFDKEVIKE